MFYTFEHSVSNHFCPVLPKRRVASFDSASGPARSGAQAFIMLPDLSALRCLAANSAIALQSWHWCTVPSPLKTHEIIMPSSSRRACAYSNDVSPLHIIACRTIRTESVAYLRCGLERCEHTVIETVHQMHRILDLGKLVLHGGFEPVPEHGLGMSCELPARRAACWDVQDSATDGSRRWRRLPLQWWSSRPVDSEASRIGAGRGCSCSHCRLVTCQ